MTAPSGWAVAKARELLQSTWVPHPDAIALALDEARAEGAEQAAQTVDALAPVVLTYVAAGRIAAAIRAGAEKKP